jgi:hypothetical protein
MRIYCLVLLVAVVQLEGTASWDGVHTSMFDCPLAGHINYPL